MRRLELIMNGVQIRAVFCYYIWERLLILQSKIWKYYKQVLGNSGLLIIFLKTGVTVAESSWHFISLGLHKRAQEFQTIFKCYWEHIFIFWQYSIHSNVHCLFSSGYCHNVFLLRMSFFKHLIYLIWLQCVTSHIPQSTHSTIRKFPK